MAAGRAAWQELSRESPACCGPATHLRCLPVVLSWTVPPWYCRYYRGESVDPEASPKKKRWLWFW